MSSTTWIGILTGVGAILGALFGLLGARLNQRQANKQLQITAEIQRDQVNASAYSEARTVWDSLIQDLQAERNSLKDKVSDLEVKVEAQNTASSQWRKRLEDVEQKRSGDRQAIHLLASYARRLLRVVEDNNLTPPQPPEGLDLTG